MIDIADFINLGFLARSPFLDLIKRFVNSSPLSVKTWVISKGKNSKHRFIKSSVFPALGFIDSIKQTSGSSVNGNKDKIYSNFGKWLHQIR